jgi:hypothetical protein
MRLSHIEIENFKLSQQPIALKPNPKTRSPRRPNAPPPSQIRASTTRTFRIQNP